MDPFVFDIDNITTENICSIGYLYYKFQIAAFNYLMYISRKQIYNENKEGIDAYLIDFLILSRHPDLGFFLLRIFILLVV